MNLRPYRVLTIDGGGARGLYTAIVLRKLAHWFSERRGCGSLDLGRGFDLIAGTSTGGILACGLAAGVDLDKIVDLYRVEGPRLFQKPLPQSSFAQLWWAICNLFSPANRAEPLRDALTRIFGDETLAELWARRRIALCIPAVDARTYQPRVFKTPHDPLRVRDNAWTLVNVSLATSAAPIVLPLAECNDPHDSAAAHAFADGGLWANNPVLVGLVEGLRLANPSQPVHVLSVGTCSPPQGAPIKTGQWGLWKWQFGLRALEMSLAAQSAGSDHLARFIAGAMGGRAVVTRLPDAPVSPEYHRAVGLDQASPRSLRALNDLAEQASSQLLSELTRGSDLGKEIASFFEELPISNPTAIEAA